MTPEEFARLLEQRDLRPKSSGAGKWEARCPAHDDGKASLSIGTGRDDQVLLQCFAGCELEQVLSALDLTTADLFASNGNGSGHPAEEYIYTDAAGAVVMKVVRKPGKKFAHSGARRREFERGGSAGARGAAYRVPLPGWCCG